MTLRDRLQQRHRDALTAEHARGLHLARANDACPRCAAPVGAWRRRLVAKDMTGAGA